MTTNEQDVIYIQYLYSTELRAERVARNRVGSLQRNSQDTYIADTIPHQDTHSSQHATRLLECTAATEKPNECHDYTTRHEDIAYDMESVDFWRVSGFHVVVCVRVDPHVDGQTQQ